jgi:glutathione S-transferase
MLLLNSIGPNPKVVRMFIAERGVTGIAVQTIDLMAGENRQEPYLSKNPTGQCPTLQLDDGSYLTEITVICEYLDEISSGKSTLIGSTPRERAETRMWTRRIDLGIVEPLVAGFRYAEGLKMFSNRMHCIPAAADDLKAIAREKLVWLDGLIAGRSFICGDRVSLADLLLFPFLEFAAGVRQKLDPANVNLTAWYERMAVRRSAQA